MKTNFKNVLTFGRILFFGLVMSASFSACGDDDDDPVIEEVKEPTQLATPTQASATVTESTAEFTWNAVANATGYSYTLKDASGATVKSDNTTSTSVSFDGLDFGVTYTLEVKATTTDTENYKDSNVASWSVETLNEVLVKEDAVFYYSQILKDFTTDLYKKKDEAGQVVYYFKDWMKDYDLEFTLDENHNMQFPKLNTIEYDGVNYYLWATDWSESYPLYLTAEEGYYIDYCYLYGAAGYNVLYPEGDPNYSNQKWGMITLSYYKYQEGSDAEPVQGYEYIYITLD